MRNPAFCICENKGADQLCGNQGLNFRYIDRTIPVLSKFCTAGFVLDLVKNPEDRFSHDAAHMKLSRTA